MKKILFIDRDGTLINEPADQQIDEYTKLFLEPDVIPSLLLLKKAGYTFVMITNQDGLGTTQFPTEKFNGPHDLLMNLFRTQGIEFEAVLICPHLPNENCECRKPKIKLVLDYLSRADWDRENSYVIGDRTTDVELAKNMKIKSIQYGKMNNWRQIVSQILNNDRVASIQRKTLETQIEVKINLDRSEPIKINTGLHFFNHMLEQLAKHGGFSLEIDAKGDLEIDEHHTVEDTAIALGQVFKKALGDKLGIQRYGFTLPMDETLCEVAIDLSGRSYLMFEGEFNREKVGDLPTELVKHFFRSFSDSAGITLNLKVKGENNHHMIESLFKGLGRALRMAIKKEGLDLPTTKGVL